MTNNFDFKNKKVLELGAGIGFISEYLRDTYNCDCLVVEGRGENIEIGKKMFPNLKFMKYDLEEKFDFGKFDYVLNFGLIYHLKNFKENLICSINSLNEKGILMVDSNVLSGSEYKIVGKKENPKIQDHTLREQMTYDFTAKVIEDIFGDMKFKRIRGELKSNNSPYDYLKNERVFYVVNK